ncbi:MAG: RNHCP domain-containing protein [Candidatus Kerfeldbacteria bacterium]
MSRTGMPYTAYMNKSKRFQRTIEDFTCDHCCTVVSGTGYTNHCPRCLWSKHVDVDPGDRKEPCNGMMEPIRIERRNRIESVVHRCTVCGRERRNSINPDDDRDAVLAVVRIWSERASRQYSL